MSFGSLYSKGWCVTHTLSQSVWNINGLQNRIVYVIKRLKPLLLDPYFQFCKYRHVLFLYDPHRERLLYARYVKLNLFAFDLFFKEKLKESNKGKKKNTRGLELTTLWL